MLRSSVLFAALFVLLFIKVEAVSTINADEFDPSTASSSALVAFVKGDLTPVTKILDELETRLQSVLIYLCDIEDNPILFERYGPSSFPGLVLFQKGDSSRIKFDGDFTTSAILSFLQHNVPDCLAHLPMATSSDSVETHEGRFSTFFGEQLPFTAWLPKGSPKGLIVYLHGAMSHGKDAEPFGNGFAARGVALYAYDQRGWGTQWKGMKGHLLDRSHYLDDAKAFLSFVRQQHPGLPVGLIGHSMGGMISTRLLETSGSEFAVGGVLAPWYANGFKIPKWKSTLGRVAAKLMPTLTLPPEFGEDALTHDEGAREKIRQEMKSGQRHMRITAAWFSELCKLQLEVIAGASDVKTPVIMLLAGVDKLVDNSVAEVVFNSMSSIDKQIRTFEGLFHELHNEREYEAVVTALADFMIPRLK